MSSQITPKDILKKQIQLSLGAQMVDVEVDNDHLNLAVLMAIQKLRQQSDGALLEKDIFIHLVTDVSEYTLPVEVQEVRRLYRRGVGALALLVHPHGILFLIPWAYEGEPDFIRCIFIEVAIVKC